MSTVLRETRLSSPQSFSRSLHYQSIPHSPQSQMSESLLSTFYSPRKAAPTQHILPEQRVRYKISFPPGPMGLELEPVIKSSDREVGCRVRDFYFATDHSGVDPAFLLARVKVGDIISSIQGEDVKSWPFADILDKLRGLKDQERVVSFRNISASWALNVALDQKSLPPSPAPLQKQLYLAPTQPAHTTLPIPIGKHARTPHKQRNENIENGGLAVSMTTSVKTPPRRVGLSVQQDNSENTLNFVHAPDLSTNMSAQRILQSPSSAMPTPVVRTAPRTASKTLSSAASTARSMQFSPHSRSSRAMLSPAASPTSVVADSGRFTPTAVRKLQSGTSLSTTQPPPALSVSAPLAQSAVSRYLSSLGESLSQSVSRGLTTLSHKLTDTVAHSLVDTVAVEEVRRKHAVMHELARSVALLGAAQDRERDRESERDRERVAQRERDLQRDLEIERLSLYAKQKETEIQVLRAEKLEDERERNALLEEKAQWVVERNAFVEEKNSLLEAWEAEQSRTHNEMTEAFDVAKAEIDRISAEKSVLTEEIERVKSELESKIAENEVLTELRQSEQTVLQEQHRVRLCAMEEETRALRVRLEDLTQERDTARAKAAELERERERLREDSLSLAERLRLAKLTADALQSELSLALADRASHEEVQRLAEEELALLRERLLSRERESELFAEREKQMEEEKTEQRDVIAKNEALIQSMEERLENEQKRVSELLLHNSSIQAGLGEWRNSFVAVQRERDVVRASVEELCSEREKEMHALRALSHSLVERLQSTCEDRDRLVIAAQHHETEIQELRETFRGEKAVLCAEHARTLQEADRAVCAARESEEQQQRLFRDAVAATRREHEAQHNALSQALAALRERENEREAERESEDQEREQLRAQLALADAELLRSRRQEALLASQTEHLQVILHKTRQELERSVESHGAHCAFVDKSAGDAREELLVVRVELQSTRQEIESLVDLHSHIVSALRNAINERERECCALRQRISSQAHADEMHTKTRIATLQREKESALSLSRSLEKRVAALESACLCTAQQLQEQTRCVGESEREARAMRADYEDRIAHALQQLAQCEKALKESHNERYTADKLAESRENALRALCEEQEEAHTALKTENIAILLELESLKKSALDWKTHSAELQEKSDFFRENLQLARREDCERMGLDIEQLKTENSTLLLEKESLTGRLRTLQTRCDELCDNEKHATTRISSILSENEMLCADLAALRETHARLTQSMHTLRVAHDLLSRDQKQDSAEMLEILTKNELLREQVQELNLSLDKEREERSQFARDNERVSAEISKAIADKQSLTDQLEELSLLLGATRSERDQCVADHQKVKAQLKAIVAEKDVLSVELQSLSERFEEERKSLAEELLLEREASAKFSADVEHFKSEIAALLAKCDSEGELHALSLRRVRDDLAAERESTQVRLAEVEAVARTHEERALCVERELEIALGKMGALQTIRVERDTVKTELLSVSSELAATQRILSSLSENNNEMFAELEALRHSEEQWLRDRGQLTTQCESEREALAAAMKELAEARAALRSLDEEKTSVERQRDKLSDRLEALSETHRALVDHRERDLSEICDLSQELDRVRLAHNALTQELDTLRGTHDTLAQSLREIESERERDARTISLLSTDCDALSAALAERESESNALSVSLSFARDRLATLEVSQDTLRTRIDSLLQEKESIEREAAAQRESVAELRACVRDLESALSLGAARESEHVACVRRLQKMAEDLVSEREKLLAELRRLLGIEDTEKRDDIAVIEALSQGAAVGERESERDAWLTALLSLSLSLHETLSLAVPLALSVTLGEDADDLTAKSVDDRAILTANSMAAQAWRRACVQQHSLHELLVRAPWSRFSAAPPALAPAHSLFATLSAGAMALPSTRQGPARSAKSLPVAAVRFVVALLVRAWRRSRANGSPRNGTCFGVAEEESDSSFCLSHSLSLSPRSRTSALREARDTVRVCVSQETPLRERDRERERERERENSLFVSPSRSECDLSLSQSLSLSLWHADDGESDRESVRRARDRDRESNEDPLSLLLEERFCPIQSPP